MKKLIFIFALLFTLILSACDPIEDEPQADLEYSDLAAKALFTHVEAESKSNDKYVVVLDHHTNPEYFGDFEIIDKYKFFLIELFLKASLTSPRLS